MDETRQKCQGRGQLALWPEPTPSASLEEEARKELVNALSELLTSAAAQAPRFEEDDRESE